MTTNLLSAERTEKTLWWLALTGAAISLILGIVFLVWPKATLHVAAILFGLWLLLHGVVYLINAITAHTADGMGRALAAVIGVFFVISGIFCLRNVTASLLVIATIIGVAWIIGGIVALAEAFSGYRSGGLRVLTGILGALTILGGLIVLFWPGPSLATLVWLTGIWLIVLGVFQLFLVLRSRPRAA